MGIKISGTSKFYSYDNDPCYIALKPCYISDRQTFGICLKIYDLEDL